MTQPTTATATQRIRRLLDASRNDPERFAATVLGAPAFDPDDPRKRPFWYRQREASALVAKYHTCVFPWGNALGKSHWSARLILWFLCTRPGSLVITTAPTFEQLDSVLWKNLRQANEASLLPLGLKINAKPLRARMAEGWGILGIATNKTERMSGHHNAELMALVDEASDVPLAIKEAIDSLVPTKFVAIGNPLREDGWFRDLARLGLKQAGDATIPDSERVATLRVPSTDSPHIHLERSSYGMACGAWLRRMEREYGIDSLWWLTHVDARFPDASHSGLINPLWIDRMGTVARCPRTTPGPRWLTVDLGEGVGRDRTVIMVGDNLGILSVDVSNQKGIPEAAVDVNRLACRYGVEQDRIVYDAGGRGKDLPRYLEQFQITEANPYHGGTPRKRKYTNKRSQMGWLLRQRLDPTRPERLPEPTPEDEEAKLSPFYEPPAAPVAPVQPPFAIPPGENAWWPKLAEEMKALKYSQEGPKIALEKKEDLVKRLGRSPDLVDALLMSFALGDDE